MLVLFLMIVVIVIMVVTLLVILSRLITMIGLSIGSGNSVVLLDEY